MRIITLKLLTKVPCTVDNINIIFEDESIVVCLKPRGIVSQEDSNGKESMVSLLRGICNSEIYPIHRLDREVAGVMVFAKNKQSAASLNSQITNGDFVKEYIAVVHSKPSEEKGVFCDLLFKDSNKNKSYVVKRERKGVKKASLEYTLLESFSVDGEVYSKIRVKLHTGRTHQIRVQFASRKMPLVADKKYGANDNFKQIGLWSYRISFSHPKTRELLTFSQEPDFVF